MRWVFAIEAANASDLLAQVAPPRKPTPKALIAPHADTR
jgi:hypothetical protein